MRDLKSWSLSSFLVFSFSMGVSAQFLSQGPGSAAGAMGGAYAAVAEDATAIFYNPAGLSFQRGSVYAEHMPVFDGGRLNFLGFHYPSHLGSIGLGVIQFSIDDIEKRKLLTDAPIYTEATQTAFFLPFGKSIRNFSLGTTIKMLDSKLDGQKESGFGLDLGSLYQKKLNDLWGIRSPQINLAATTKNIFENSNELTRQWGGGVSLMGDVLSRFSKRKNEVISDQLRLSVDGQMDENNEKSFYYGSEYSFRNLIHLRVGYNDALTMGMGYGGAQSRFKIDYSMLSNDLNAQHRFSFSLYFTEAKAVVDASPQLRKYNMIKKDARRYKQRSEEEGRKHLSQRQYELAFLEFQKAWVLDPHDRKVEKYMKRSKEGIRQKELKAIAKQKEQWINDVQSHFYQSTLENDYAQATDLVMKANTVDPDSHITQKISRDFLTYQNKQFDFLIDEANLALSQNNIQDSYVFYTQAQEINPTNENLVSQLTNMKISYQNEMKFGHYDEVYQDQLYKLAAIHFVSNEWSDAERTLENLLSKNAIHEDAHRLKKILKKTIQNEEELKWEKINGMWPYSSSVQ